MQTLLHGVPDSGLDAALGYSKESGVHYDMVFTKSKYIGRTFIQNTQDTRRELVGLKLNPIKTSVKDRKIVLIDDSIVRRYNNNKTYSSTKKSRGKRSAFKNCISCIYGCMLFWNRYRQ